jgi:hypothetical protein
MTTARFSVLIGLVIGVVWAFTGIAGAFVAALLTAVGGAVGYLVSHGVIDLSAIVGRRDDD